MAHKKAGGSTKNGRESESKRLGVKKSGGAARARGQHPRAPAWHAVPRWRQRRHRYGPHAVRAHRRQRAVPPQGRRAAHARVRGSRHELSAVPRPSRQGPGNPGAFAFWAEHSSLSAIPRPAAVHHEVRRRSHDQGPGRQRRARHGELPAREVHPVRGAGRRRRRPRRQHLLRRAAGSQHAGRFPLPRGASRRRTASRAAAPTAAAGAARTSRSSCPLAR